MAEKAAEYPEPRFYSREFKLEAVRLSDTSGKSMSQTARELGLPDGVLYTSIGGVGSSGTRLIS